MTLARPPPPFVVFDPLLWVGFREAVKGALVTLEFPQLVGLRDKPVLGLASPQPFRSCVTLGKFSLQVR